MGLERAVFLRRMLDRAQEVQRQVIERFAPRRGQGPSLPR
jgi:hypothetical protein